MTEKTERGGSGTRTREGGECFERPLLLPIVVQVHSQHNPLRSSEQDTISNRWTTEQQKNCKSGSTVAVAIEPTGIDRSNSKAAMDSRALPRRWIQQIGHFPAGGSKLRLAPRRSSGGGATGRGSREDELRATLAPPLEGGERSRRGGTEQTT